MEQYVVDESRSNYTEWEKLRKKERMIYSRVYIKLRKMQANLQSQKVGHEEWCWRAKGECLQWEDFLIWCEWYVHYLDCVYGFMGKYLC